MALLSKASFGRSPKSWPTNFHLINTGMRPWVKNFLMLRAEIAKEIHLREHIFQVWRIQTYQAILSFLWDGYLPSAQYYLF